MTSSGNTTASGDVCTSSESGSEDETVLGTALVPKEEPTTSITQEIHPTTSDGEMTVAVKLETPPTTSDGEMTIAAKLESPPIASDVEMTAAATLEIPPTNSDGEMTIAAKLAGSKRKRNLPGTPDPDAEVVALSPKTLMATHKFTCEVCGRGFQREQNLQLHKRGHNLPGSLKPRADKEKEVRKKVYVCPEAACIHHDPSRALGDLTGIKKHFCRKHGEKKWQCDKCSKKYAVLSDWKAHSKTCGTRDYKCECGSIFYRRDSFVTHKAFCDELTEESARLALVKGSP